MTNSNSISASAVEAKLRREEIIEECAVRIETYALALEIEQHMGMPHPLECLTRVAEKVRELKHKSITRRINAEST